MSAFVESTLTLLEPFGQNTALGGPVSLLLIILLAVGELAAVAGDRFHPLAQNLMLAIVPLLIVFVMAVIARVAALLSTT